MANDVEAQRASFPAPRGIKNTETGLRIPAMLAWSGVDTGFFLQGPIELADQPCRLKAHVNWSSEFCRHKSADKARTKPLSLWSGNRWSTHLAPNDVNAFRWIPKDGP